MPELRHRAVLAQLRSSRALRAFLEQLNWRATGIHRHPKIDRAQDRAGRIAFQFDVAESPRGARLDAVAQPQELLFALGCRRPQNGEIGLALDRDRRHSHLYQVSSHRNGLATAETMLLNAQS
jgi:hypothetical protein